MDNVNKNNKELLLKLREYLENDPCMITQDLINDVKKSGVSTEYAYATLLSSFLELDDNFLDQYILAMLRKEDPNTYINNLFYQKMDYKAKLKEGKLELDYTYIEPYQLFMQDEVDKFIDGKLLPQIGFFDDDLKCLSIIRDDETLYSYNPLLVNASIVPLDEAKGKICCMGLGIGYFPYMAHLKEDVKSIVIYEKNKDLIKLFNNHLFKRFKYKDKIKVVEGDPLIILKSKSTKLNADYVYINCWNDLGEALKLYPKFKALEKNFPRNKFHYYLEQSIKLYPKDE